MKEHIQDILLGGRPMTKAEILQKRIDKAIEYIEELKKLDYFKDNKNLPILLTILKGDSDE